MPISKPYSTIPKSVRALAKRNLLLVAEPNPAEFTHYDALSDHLIGHGLEVAKARLAGTPRLILLDDGGLLTEVWSARFRADFPDTVSIQQTSSGVRRPGLPGWGIAYVDVARSVAKTVFESPAIAGGVARKLHSLGQCSSDASVGVIGTGAIGARIATMLARRGRNVLTFDRRAAIPTLRGVVPRATAAELLDRAHIVLGCTGTDWMSPEDLDRARRRPHLFASCSPRDVEFASLLAAPDSTGHSNGKRNARWC